MSFKDMVNADNLKIFLNNSEFAEIHDIQYDGTTYNNIPIVISGIKEQNRTQTVSDHAQGLYLVTSVLHCRISDLSNKQPEKGQKIRISSSINRNFFREYYVASSVCEHGMIRIELEAIDE